MYHIYSRNEHSYLFFPIRFRGHVHYAGDLFALKEDKGEAKLEPVVLSPAIRTAAPSSAYVPKAAK